MAASMGHQAQLCMDASAIDGSSEPYEFVSESLAEQAEILDTNGIRGTRSHSKERTRQGLKQVQGQITLHPSPLDLDNLLPRILGAAESSDSFALAETLPEFNVMIDRVADAFLYSACQISKATFRGSAGQYVELVLDIIAKTETEGQTFPSLTLGTSVADEPFVFSDGVMTLQGATREVFDFELVIDNAGSARYTIGSNTATDILISDRIVTLGTNCANVSGNAALLKQATGGAAGTLVFTNGNVSTTFSFAALQAPNKTPTVTGKGEIPINLEMTARKSGSTNEIVITNDSNSAS